MRRGFHFRSFKYAINGVRLLVVTQPNAGVHVVAATGALALAAVMRFSAMEWAILVLAITTVWVAEGLNTAIEFVVNLISPDQHRLAGAAKDAAAGAVLLAAVGAVVAGGFLFIPKLLHWMQQ